MKEESSTLVTAAAWDKLLNQRREDAAAVSLSPPTTGSKGLS